MGAELTEQQPESRVRVRIRVQAREYAEARIVFSWTTTRSRVRGRFVAGEAQLAKPQGGKSWRNLRDAWLLREWWRAMPDYEKGVEGPDFGITLYAPFVAAAAEANFGALQDHELFHCAQARDGYGVPRRSQSDGRPAWEMRGHDVEQFIAVIRRWGIGSDPDAERLVAAARQRPEIAAAKIQEGMCGTCRRAVA
jgi:hypothetical protein